MKPLQESQLQGDLLDRYDYNWANYVPRRARKPAVGSTIQWHSFWLPGASAYSITEFITSTEAANGFPNAGRVVLVLASMMPEVNFVRLCKDEILFLLMCVAFLGSYAFKLRLRDAVLSPTLRKVASATDKIAWLQEFCPRLVPLAIGKRCEAVPSSRGCFQSGS